MNASELNQPVKFKSWCCTDLHLKKTFENFLRSYIKQTPSYSMDWQKSNASICRIWRLGKWDHCPYHWDYMVKFVLKHIGVISGSAVTNIYKQEYIMAECKNYCFDLTLMFKQFTTFLFWFYLFITWMFFTSAFDFEIMFSRYFVLDFLLVLIIVCYVFF